MAVTAMALELENGKMRLRATAEQHEVVLLDKYQNHHGCYACILCELVSWKAEALC